MACPWERTVWWTAGRVRFLSSRSSLAVHYLCDFLNNCFIELYSLGRCVLDRLSSQAGLGVLSQHEVGRHFS